MSVYAINKVCFLVERDPAFRERLLREPERLLAEFKLTPDERLALRAGDVIALYRMGAHPFLLQYLGRYGAFGLSLPVYRQRIQSIDSGAGTAGDSPAPLAVAQAARRDLPKRKRLAPKASRRPRYIGAVQAGLTPGPEALGCSLAAGTHSSRDRGRLARSGRPGPGRSARPPEGKPAGAEARRRPRCIGAVQAGLTPGPETPSFPSRQVQAGLPLDGGRAAQREEEPSRLARRTVAVARSGQLRSAGPAERLAGRARPGGFHRVPGILR